MKINKIPLVVLVKYQTHKGKCKYITKGGHRPQLLTVVKTITKK